MERRQQRRGRGRPWEQGRPPEMSRETLQFIAKRGGMRKTVDSGHLCLAAAAAGFVPLGGARDHEDVQPAFARLR